MRYDLYDYNYDYELRIGDISWWGASERGILDFAFCFSSFSVYAELGFKVIAYKRDLISSRGFRRQGIIKTSAYMLLSLASIPRSWCCYPLYEYFI